MMRTFSMHFLLLLLACSDKTPSRSTDLILRDTFTEVLTDVRLLEGAYSTRVARPDTIKPKMEAYYQLLFDKHGVTKQQFSLSYEYYMNKGELMAIIEDAVMEKLNAMHTAQPSTSDSTSVSSVDTLESKHPSGK